MKLRIQYATSSAISLQFYFNLHNRLQEPIIIPKFALPEARGATRSADPRCALGGRREFRKLLATKPSAQHVRRKSNF